MTSDRFEYEAIGVIRTPFDSPEGMPIQPVGNDATEGIVEVEEAYEDGLKDLNGFTHCILLYHFHASPNRSSLQVEPFLDDKKEACSPHGPHSGRTESGFRSSRSIPSRVKK